MDRGALWIQSRGHKESDMTEQLNNNSNIQYFGLPGWLSRKKKNLPANAGEIGDTGLILGLGRSSGEGNSNPLQYSCLGNSMDRRAWWATVHGIAKSQTD